MSQSDGSNGEKWISVLTARDASMIGKDIEVRGWVRTRRDSKGGFSFIELNDGSCQGNVQVVAPAALDNYETVVKHLHTGASVSIEGEVKAEFRMRPWQLYIQHGDDDTGVRAVDRRENLALRHRERSRADVRVYIDVGPHRHQVLDHPHALGARFCDVVRAQFDEVHPAEGQRNVGRAPCLDRVRVHVRFLGARVRQMDDVARIEVRET